MNFDDDLSGLLQRRVMGYMNGNVSHRHCLPSANQDRDDEWMMETIARLKRFTSEDRLASDEIFYWISHATVVAVCRVVYTS
jgi:hypothetical protein